MTGVEVLLFMLLSAAACGTAVAAALVHAEHHKRRFCAAFEGTLGLHVRGIESGDIATPLCFFLHDQTRAFFVRAVLRGDAPLWQLELDVSPEHRLPQEAWAIIASGWPAPTARDLVESVPLSATHAVHAARTDTSAHVVGEWGDALRALVPADLRQLQHRSGHLFFEFRRLGLHIEDLEAVLVCADAVVGRLYQTAVLSPFCSGESQGVGDHNGAPITVPALLLPARA